MRGKIASGATNKMCHHIRGVLGLGERTKTSSSKFGSNNLINSSKALKQDQNNQKMVGDEEKLVYLQ